MFFLEKTETGWNRGFFKKINNEQDFYSHITLVDQDEEYRKMMQSFCCCPRTNFRLSSKGNRCEPEELSTFIPKDIECQNTILGDNISHPDIIFILMLDYLKKKSELNNAQLTKQERLQKKCNHVNLSKKAKQQLEEYIEEYIKGKNQSQTLFLLNAFRKNMAPQDLFQAFYKKQLKSTGLIFSFRTDDSDIVTRIYARFLLSWQPDLSAKQLYAQLRNAKLSCQEAIDAVSIVYHEFHDNVSEVAIKNSFSGELKKDFWKKIACASTGGICLGIAFLIHHFYRR